MSELISGKDAYFAIGNGEIVQQKYYGDRDSDGNSLNTNWEDINPKTYSLYNLFSCNDDDFEYRLKPKTMIASVNIPINFKPNIGEHCFVLSSFNRSGYEMVKRSELNEHFLQFGAWRTEDDIKKVVDAQRCVFKSDLL